MMEHYSRHVKLFDALIDCKCTYKLCITFEIMFDSLCINIIYFCFKEVLERIRNLNCF